MTHLLLPIMISKIIKKACKETLKPALIILLALAAHQTYAQKQLTLIAHRGGVVDSSYTENGITALSKAATTGYKMIETDVRVTKDGILVVNHDADLKRYYGLDKKVADLEWQEIRKLKSTLDGNTPIRLEDVLRFCHEHAMGVMLDNKIAGLDTTLFNRMIGLLDQYDLLDTALMIGTEESTDFFTGKIKLSCSRRQLEENMQKPGYNASHYFLFERPAKLSKEDLEWASNHHLTVVAAINKYHYRQSADMLKDAAIDCRRMLDFGVQNFQIDSEFQSFLK
jgi:glycerophosphoryl diester phosphodiesterase